MIVRRPVAIFTNPFFSTRPCTYIRFLTYCFAFLITITASIPGVSATDFINSADVTIPKIFANPAAYDGSITLIKVSLIGNLTNINNPPMYISDGENHIKLYAPKNLLYGFNESTQILITGQFSDNAIKEDEIEIEFAEYYPKVEAGTIEIKELNTHPVNYNGKYVDIYGDVLRMHEFLGLGYIIHIGNNSTNEYIKTRYYGSANFKIGETAHAHGLFNGEILYASKLERYEAKRDLYSSIKYGFLFLCAMAVIATTIWYIMERKRNKQRF